MRILLILFVAIPVIEVLILIKLGETIGFFPTVFFVLGMGFAGAMLARLEGLRNLIAIQAEIRAGRLPGERMIDALILFIAGVFLILPGLLSDFAGLFLLIPVTRNLFKNWVRKMFDDLVKVPRQSGGSRHTIEITPEE